MKRNFAMFITAMVVVVVIVCLPFFSNPIDTPLKLGFEFCMEISSRNRFGSKMVFNRCDKIDPLICIHNPILLYS